MNNREIAAKDEVGDEPQFSWELILEVVRDNQALPEESARPFAKWLEKVWNSWTEEGQLSPSEVVAKALAYWRGQ